jgi:hypothetical protein
MIEKMNGNLVARLASGVIIAAIAGIVACIKIIFRPELFEQ